MKLLIDTNSQTLTRQDDQGSKVVPLYSDEAFEWISEQWLKVGWNQKYSYTFSWFGRPVIQLPEDMIRIQEVIYRVRPDVILETGVAHGGSLVFYASLFKAMGRGRVIGVDIEIRPHNRTAIESHELASYITLIEGGSTTPDTQSKVRSLIRPGETVLVILDSNHTRDHVLDELNAYHDLVSFDSYIVATDGIMKDLSDAPRGHASWDYDNPTVAAALFQQKHPEFLLEQPAWLFNQSTLSKNLTHWPGSFLRRIR